jgi:hypothetical protein
VSWKDLGSYSEKKPFEITYYNSAYLNIKNEDESTAMDVDNT